MLKGRQVWRRGCDLTEMVTIRRAKILMCSTANNANDCGSRDSPIDVTPEGIRLYGNGITTGGRRGSPHQQQGCTFTETKSMVLIFAVIPLHLRDSSTLSHFQRYILVSIRFSQRTRKYCATRNYEQRLQPRMSFMSIISWPATITVCAK